MPTLQQLAGSTLNPILVAAKQKRALLAREQTLAREMLRLYSPLRAELRTAIEVLKKKIATLEIESATSAEWKLARLEAILAQTEAAQYQAALKAGGVTTQAQLASITHGIADATALAHASELAAWHTINTQALETFAGYTQEGTPLATLFQKINVEQVDSMKQILFDGMAQGTPASKIGKALSESVDELTQGRGIIIARQESVRMYREGNIESYRANSDMVKSWQWKASLNASVCPSCLALDQTIHPLSEQFGSHPGCFLPGTIVEGPKVLATNARWYNGEVVNVQFSNGHEFTVTKNHPILTAKGWVAAGLLNDGDDVVSYAFTERPLHGISPDNYQIPTRIEDIVNTFASKFGTVTECMPGTSEDFHSDGIAGEVNICSFLDCKSYETTDNCLVDEYRLLQTVRDGQGTFQRKERGYGIFDKYLYLFQKFLSNQQKKQKDLDTLLFAGGYSQVPYCGCANKILSRFFAYFESILHLPIEWRLFLREFLHDALFCNYENVPVDLLSRVQSSDVDARSKYYRDLYGHISQGAGDNYYKYPYGNNNIVTGIRQEGKNGDNIVTGSDVVNFLASSIPSDNFSLVKVVAISTRLYSGHVYNLQTSEEWYSANTIIAHNCRCQVLMVTDINMVDYGQTGSDWFAEQPADVQRDMLGNTKYELYSRGHVTLTDLLDRHNTEWGPTAGQKSLKALIGEGKVTKEQVLSAGKKISIPSKVDYIKPFTPQSMSLNEVEKYTEEWGATLRQGKSIYANNLASDTKAEMENKLHETLKDNTSWKELVTGNKTLSDAEFIEASKQKTSDLVKVWATSSANNNPESIALQLAAKDEFNLKGTYQKYGIEEVSKAKEILSKNGDAYKSFLRAQYDNTQILLKEKGISKVTLFRGVLEDESVGSYIGNAVEIRNMVLQPISSFSTDHEIAIQFATDKEYKQIGRIIAIDTPREAILSTPLTGLGCLNESEFVVLGGESKVTTVAWKPRLETGKLANEFKIVREGLFK